MEQFDETSYSWNLKALQVEKFFLKRRKQKVENVKRKKRFWNVIFRSYDLKFPARDQRRW